jgi:hypothetical protein
MTSFWHGLRTRIRTRILAVSSLGERVGRTGDFISRGGPGEGVSSTAEAFAATISLSHKHHAAYVFSRHHTTHVIQSAPAPLSRHPSRAVMHLAGQRNSALRYATRLDDRAGKEVL